MWKEVTKNLGRIKVGVATDIKFYYQGDGKHIGTKVSCGCTDAKWNKDLKVLEVVYNSKDIPLHLAQRGDTEYPSKKVIKVTMIENSQQVIYDLLIQAQVYKL